MTFRLFSTFLLRVILYVCLSFGKAKVLTLPFIIFISESNLSILSVMLYESTMGAFEVALCLWNLIIFYHGCVCVHVTA